MAYLGTEVNEVKKNRIFKLAEKRGVEIRKNNISKAKPLEIICGNLKASFPMNAKQLFCR
jgi:hypothetical protein